MTTDERLQADNETIDHLRERVGRLEALVDEERERANTATTLANHRHADLMQIAGALRAEAIRRQWCPEYQDFVDRVNADCHEAHLQSCYRNYRTHFAVRVDFQAGNRDAAVARLRDQIERLNLDEGEGVIDIEVSGSPVTEL